MKENQKKLPIIFIHGMWKGSWIFGDWLDFVLTADGRDTYVPSLRGYNSKHDDNNIVTGIVSIYDYVNDIKNFVKQKGINHYDIVGYSAGGLIGQVLASRDERVRSVTYVASLPPKGIKVRGAGVSQLGWEFLFKCLLRMSIPYPWERKNDVAPFFDASGRFFYEVWKGVPIKKVRCQSLAVITQGDLVISKETQIKAARRYGAYQILVRKGHQVVLEDYDKVVIQNILKWIDILPFPE